MSHQICSRCGRPKIQANVRPTVPQLSADALYLLNKQQREAVDQIFAAAMDEHFAPAPPAILLTDKENQQNRAFVVNQLQGAEPLEFIDAPSWFFAKSN